MSPATFFRHVAEAFHGAGSVARYSLRILVKDPHLMVYPALALSFIAVTSPFISHYVLQIWDRVNHPAVISEVSHSAPHVLLVHLGLVTFSFFYAAFVTAYFICAMSAGVLAKLDAQPTSPLYGLRVVLKNFWKITKFALAAIFFLPLAVIAQRSKLPKGIIGVLGSSFSLNMAQLAPAILTEDRSVFETIRVSIDTLGQAWRESLVLRIGLYVALLALTSISFLPKLIQHYWFRGESAHLIGWFVTAVLGVVSYIMLRVIATVFTTTLYHRARAQPKK